MNFSLDSIGAILISALLAAEQEKATASRAAANKIKNKGIDYPLGTISIGY